MNTTLLKQLLVVFVIIAVIAGAVYLGIKNKKIATPAPQPVPVAPIPVPPSPPIQPNYSTSYIQGYNDGYSGNWLAPLHWFFVNDYRTGWNAGHQDRANGLPNKLNKIYIYQYQR